MVERAFATGYGQVRAMLNGGGFFEKNQSAFWAEAASTAADLDDIWAYKSGTPGDFLRMGRNQSTVNIYKLLVNLGSLQKGAKRR